MLAPWYAGVGQDPLDRSFVSRPTVEVAHDLIGCWLAVRDPLGTLVGRIVETEAYTGGNDAASHAAKRRTGLVAVMWGEPGRAYVYTSYGLHSMLNVVAKQGGDPGGVLVRAVEVVKGHDVIEIRRSGVPLRRLAAGPGLVCRAFGISSSDHGAELIRGERFALMHGDGPSNVHVGGRIGISRAMELPYRFFDADSNAVSAHRRGLPVSSRSGS
jgi:DNA-3-methyladenine glycosylase